MTPLLLVIAMMGFPLDYSRVDKIPYGQSVSPDPDQRRIIVADATIEKLLREPEGLHVLMFRDKEKLDPQTKWLPWIDAKGRPWLLKDVDGWHVRLWQATEWRTWSFSSDQAWCDYWNTTPTRPSVQGQLNFGVSGNWAGSGSTSSESPVCPIHGQQPCPGPGPCPRPSPRPGPDDCPLFPDLTPKVSVNIDPTIVAIVGGVVGFLGLSIMALLGVILIRRRAS